MPSLPPARQRAPGRRDTSIQVAVDSRPWLASVGYIVGYLTLRGRFSTRLALSAFPTRWYVVTRLYAAGQPE